MGAPPPPSAEDFTFRYAMRVRWSDVDPQWVVFNPNYLVYADHALTEYFRALGLPVAGSVDGGGAESFAVRSEVNFRSSARFDDEIEVLVRTEQLGRSSYRVLFLVLRGGEVLADIRSTYVNADPEAKASAPLPARLVDAVLAFERVAPER